MGTTASRIEATATGRKATDANGKDLKPTPVSLTFEFLDASGKVLGKPGPEHSRRWSRERPTS